MRFGSSLYEDPKAVLKELRQTDSVSKYHSKFEELSTKVTGSSEEWLISFFIAGLQGYLMCKLLLAQVETYFHVVSLAMLHEQKYLSCNLSRKTQ